jgi:hypothetical protein
VLLEDASLSLLFATGMVVVEGSGSSEKEEAPKAGSCGILVSSESGASVSSSWSSEFCKMILRLRLGTTVVDGKITKDQACKKDNPRQRKTSFQEDNMVVTYWGQCLQSYATNADATGRVVPTTVSKII